MTRLRYISKQGFPQSSFGFITCCTLTLVRTFGGSNCTARIFPGLFQLSEIGGSISLIVQKPVFHSRFACRRCYVLRHVRHIVMQKSNPIQGKREERVIQSTSKSLPIGGLRFIEAIQSDEVEHEKGVRGGKVRIQTDCLSAFLNPFLILSNDAIDCPRQIIMRKLRA